MVSNMFLLLLGFLSHWRISMTLSWKWLKWLWVLLHYRNASSFCRKFAQLIWDMEKLISLLFSAVGKSSVPQRRYLSMQEWGVKTANTGDILHWKSRTEITLCVNILLLEQKINRNVTEKREGWGEWAFTTLTLGSIIHCVMVSILLQGSPLFFLPLPLFAIQNIPAF